MLSDLVTSISHKALELVAAVADVRPVVRRNTYCFFLYSSPVRNFSCSAWKSRTTSPYSQKTISMFTETFPALLSVEKPHNISLFAEDNFNVHRNFSCSAWKSHTTSPYSQKTISMFTETFLALLSMEKSHNISLFAKDNFNVHRNFSCSAQHGKVTQHLPIRERQFQCSQKLFLLCSAWKSHTTSPYSQKTISVFTETFPALLSMEKSHNISLFTKDNFNVNRNRWNIRNKLCRIEGPMTNDN